MREAVILQWSWTADRDGSTGRHERMAEAEMVAESAPGMGMKNRPLTAIVCDYDPIWLPAAVERVRSAGFEVLGDAISVVDGLRWSQHLKPSLVVVTNEHSGLTALQAIDDFKAQDHHPEVLVLSTSQIDRQFFLRHGALLLAGRFDNEGFDQALADAKDYLITGERRKKVDRRQVRDRRVAQDWQMVTKERRVLADRRRNDRRTMAEIAASVTAAADEATDLHGVFARAIARANAVAANQDA